MKSSTPMQGLLALSRPCKRESAATSDGEHVDTTTAREKTMRSTILLSAAGLVFFLGSVFANAQSQKIVAINVPFDFMVGKTMFPAGAYTVNPIRSHTLVLRARNGYEFVVMKTQSLSIRNQPVLIASHSANSGILFVNDGHHCRLQKARMNSVTEELLASKHVLGKPIWIRVSGEAPRPSL